MLRGRAVVIVGMWPRTSAPQRLLSASLPGHDQPLGLGQGGVVVDKGHLPFPGDTAVQFEVPPRGVVVRR